MLKTLGIVQACFEDDDSRTKATGKLRGKAVLEWAVRRVTDSMRLDGVIVVARCPAEHLRHGSGAPGRAGVRRPAGHPLGRFLAALEAYPAESAVRVRADHPFVDPGLIDRSVATAAMHPDCDYVSYSLRDGRPAIFSRWGCMRSGSAWPRCARRPCGPGARHRREVTRYLYSHPEKFKIRLLPARR